MLDAGLNERLTQPDDPAELVRAVREVWTAAAGDPQQIEAICRDRLRRNPSTPFLHVLLADILLTRGDWRVGFEEMRWYDFYPNMQSWRSLLTVPEWDGTPMLGNTILLVADQGFGDVLLFCRFVAAVNRRVGKVVLVCAKELVPLLERIPEVDAVCLNFAQAPRCDVFSALSDLPRIFGVEPHTLPKFSAYVAPNPFRVTRWRRRLDRVLPQHRPRVGICWRAGADCVTGSPRSMKLLDLAPIFEAAPSVDFVSLQLPLTAEDREFPIALKSFTAFSAELTDFGETAALIENLDFVITIDTAVANLAGAMGKPAFVLLSKPADWRWGLEPESTIWFPTLRLFRSQRVGDWSGPVAEAAAALTGMLDIGLSETPQQALDRACLLAEARQFTSAEAICRSLQINYPQAGAVLGMLGRILAEDRARRDEAIALSEAAVRADPNTQAWRSNLCYLYRIGYDLDKALEHGLDAVSLNPRDLDALTQLGETYLFLGEREAAEALYWKRLDIAPDNALVRAAVGELLLSRGDYTAGWREWSTATKTLSQINTTTSQAYAPYWNGVAMPGCTILLSEDQGCGDAIQLVRFVPQVRSRVSRVVLACRPELTTLLGTVQGVDAMVAHDDDPPPHHAFAKLTTLPHMLGCVVNTIPAVTPYLRADPERVSWWGSRLAALPAGRLRVGLAWRAAQYHWNGPARSLPLAALRQILDTPGIEFVSLQVPFLAEDRSFSAGLPHFHEFSVQLWDFAETAALIENLNLVVCVDTAMTHLSGALGKECWVLIPKPCDWRWLLNRTDSPWYPKMRLYQQRTPGDWSAVVVEAAAALRGKVAAGRPNPG